MTTAFKIKPRTAPDKLTRFCRTGLFNIMVCKMYASKPKSMPMVQMGKQGSKMRANS
jgi:hypothetical protein